MFSKPGAFKKALIVLSLIIFTGCSFLKLSYNYGELYIMYKLDRYFDFNDIQEDLTRKYLLQFHTWHRSQELQRYENFIHSIRTAVENNLTRNLIDHYYDQIERFREDLLTKVIPYAADFFTKIDKEQLSRLEEKLENENEEIQDEIDRSPGIKQENMLKKGKEKAEEWIGTLETDQITMITTFLKTTPDFNTIRLPHRLQTQKQFFEGIRKENRLSSNKLLLTRLWVNSYNDENSDYYKQRAVYREKFKALLLNLYQSLTAEQKKFLTTKLLIIEKDLADLRQGGE